MAAFKLFTDEFSGWYLEMIKPAYQAPIDKETLASTLGFFERLMQIIHPFMPFITEELYQAIAPRKDGESIMTSTLSLEPLGDREQSLIEQYEIAKQIISGVRAVRQSKNIPQRDPLTLEVVVADGERNVTRCPALGPVIKKMAGLDNIEYVSSKSEGTSLFIVGTTEYAVPMGKYIDVDEELRKLNDELKYQEGFLASVMKKLSNEKFVNGAPEKVVAAERKKQADAEARIEAIKDSIKTLGKS